MDHEKYGLKPKHRIMAAHPTINDALPDRILSGTVVIKGDVDHFTENGIVFAGKLIITNYQLKLPILTNN